MTKFSLIVVYQLFNFPTTYNNIPKKGPLGTSQMPRIIVRGIFISNNTP